MVHRTLMAVLILSGLFVPEQVTVSDKGDYEIMVYAFDPRTGNTGVDRVKVSMN